MKKIRIFLAIIACKFLRFVLRLLGKGGTNLPGKTALAIYPDILGYLAKDVTTTVVTGTNGKTTSVRMLEQCMLDAGMDFFVTGRALI